MLFSRDKVTVRWRNNSVGDNPLLFHKKRWRNKIEAFSVKGRQEMVSWYKGG
jgi:hypothetical protein